MPNKDIDNFINECPRCGKYQTHPIDDTSFRKCSHGNCKINYGVINKDGWVSKSYHEEPGTVRAELVGMPGGGPVITILMGDIENEDMPVVLKKRGDGECFIEASNEGGFNYTSVSLQDILKWTAEHMPDLYLEGANKALSSRKIVSGSVLDSIITTEGD